MAGARLEPEILSAAAGEIKDQYLNSLLAEKILGWRARTPLEEGLTISLTWYKNYLS